MKTFLVTLSLTLATLVGARVRAEAPVTAAALTPDGQQVVLGSQQGIEVRSWPDLKVAARVPSDLVHVHDLSFSPDGHTLLAAGGTPAEQGAVEVLRWPQGTRVRRVTGHDDVVYRVAWSPSGQEFAAAGGDGLCRIIDAATGQPLSRYEGHSRAVLAVTYLPDGRTVASAGVDQTLRLWESSSGKHLRTLDNHVGSVTGLAVQPYVSPQLAAILVSISDDRTVRFWQPTIGRMMRFARLPSPPRAVVWASDESRVFVGCDDGNIRVVDPATAQVVAMFAAQVGHIHELVVDSTRGRWLVGGEKGFRTGRISADMAGKNTDQR